MSRNSSRELNWAEPWLFGASLLVLALCTVYGVFGINLPRGLPWQPADWKVVEADLGCSVEPCLRPGDELTAIGDVTREEFMSSPSQPIFSLGRGEKQVTLTFVRGDTKMQTTYDWHDQPFAKQIDAILVAAVPMGFWVLGTLTIIFVRPRDSRWFLLTALYYVLAVFVASGLLSHTQSLYSAFLVHIAAALLLPISVQLHLTLPSRAFPRLGRFLVPIVWLAGGGLLLADLLGGLPPEPMRIALIASLILSVAVFGARFLRKAKPQVRAAEHVMLAGCFLGLLPVLLNIGANWLGLYSLVAPLTAKLLTALLYLVLLPMWPLSYLWAIYRADLGRIEVRANRALGAYGFWCGYLTTYVMVFLVLAAFSDWFGDNTLLAGLLVSVVFVSCAPWLRGWFQRFIDWRIFGMPVTPEQLPQQFASKIPEAFDRDELCRIVTGEILPSLLVRQSALLLFEDTKVDVLYVQGLEEPRSLLSRNVLDEIASSAGKPRKTRDDDPPQLRWVRLALVLESRKERYGIWLFGRRDPEDAYPRSDVEVLSSLANQITAVLRARTEIERRRRLQDQLIQSQKMEAIGRLSAGVAHDFNNLLSAILGYSDLLLGSDSDSLGAERAFVEGIKEAGEKAAALTTQLLAFSRQQVMATRVVNLNEVVSQLENLLRRVIEEDIELRTSFLEGDLFVRIDPGQMEQVLLNLVVNACDAMGDGGHLEIATGRVKSSNSQPAHADVPPGDYVTLTVADDGTGIEPEVRDRIFEPFFTTKVPGQGTGLGLAMVYGIVNQSRGHITVDSEPGVGTTFTLFLPLARTAPKPEPAALPENRAPSGPETILLVEDEQSVRRVVREILKSRGYTVVAAEDGRAALQLADGYEGTIDLLLTDVMMPHVKGPELADELQQRRPGLKVVYMSGYNEESVLGERLRTGNTVLLRKPFAPELLAREIRKALDGEAAPTPA